MFTTKNSNNFLLGFAFLSLALALSLHRQFERPVILAPKQASAINVNHNFLKIMSAGNKRLISSLIWIQTLLESDVERYGNRDLNNWMYLRFMTISSLDPLFYENYLWGGMYLSIIKDDLKGAASIYEKGIAHYPNDYNLLYNAGFNYYIEMEDNVNGLRLLEKIATHPKSPEFLKFIVNKLKYETGTDYESIMSFLIHQHQLSLDPFLKARLARDIYSLKAEHDLKCLNSKEAHACSQKDAEGNSYFFKDGRWQSLKNYNAYRIFRNQNSKHGSDVNPSVQDR